MSGSPTENSSEEHVPEAMGTTLQFEVSFGFNQIRVEWQRGLKQYAMTHPHPERTTRVLIVASDNAKHGQPASATEFYYQLVFYNGHDKILDCTPLTKQIY